MVGVHWLTSQTGLQVTSCGSRAQSLALQLWKLGNFFSPQPLPVLSSYIVVGPIHYQVVLRQTNLI